MSKSKNQVAAIERPGTEFARVVRERSFPRNLIHSAAPFLWSFCKFCGRQTEYAVAIESVRIFKRLKNGEAKAVPFTEVMRAAAQEVANNLVALYEQAIAGELGPFAVGEMLVAYGDIREMGGDSSVAAFRDFVERRARITEWSKHGDIYGAARLPGTPKGGQRPSKLYCDLHYPGRSVEARRAYQRDRRFLHEYDEINRQLWSAYAGHLRRWSIEDETLVRHAAYHIVRTIKAPTRFLEEHFGTTTSARSQRQLTTSHTKSIEDYYEVARASYHTLRNMMKVSNDWLDDLRENGITNQAEIARRLGVKRQAVSAALKRKRK